MSRLIKWLRANGLELVSWLAGVCIGGVVVTSDAVTQAGFTTLGKMVIFALWILMIKIIIRGGKKNAR